MLWSGSSKLVSDDEEDDENDEVVGSVVVDARSCLVSNAADDSA